MPALRGPGNPMKRSRTLALAALALGAGAWLGWPSKRSDEPVLAIPADALRLGEVWAQSGFRWSLPLENHSDRAIEVTHLACAPCGCCKFEPAALVIPPGEQRQVVLTIDLGPHNERQSGAAVRDVRLNVIAVTGDSGPPCLWELSAKV